MKNSEVLKNVPVFTVEVNDYKELIASSDVIGMNIHPFHDRNIGVTGDAEVMSDMALEFTKKKYNEVRMKYGHKEVYITETGWPSKSERNEKNYGSVTIQKLYFKVNFII